MVLPHNPFLHRLTRFLDPKVLRAGLPASAQPIAGLELLPPHTAKRRLEEHLQTVYAPTAPGIELAMRILSSALAHALRVYPDVRTYVTTATQARIDVTTEPEVWVMTGLAGDGKTALVTALNRLMGEGEFFDAPTHCPTRRVRGGVFLTMHPKTTKAEVVAALAERLELELDCERAKPIHFEKIRLELYRQGCCFILADEAQSNDAGKIVGAAYVNLINLLRRFGLPVIVVGNYSMCHGLLKQHSQNRQRLLNDPFIMPTLASDDADYLAHLREYQKALEGLLTINVKDDAGRVHWLTAGGGRALVHLIGIAYRTRHERGGGANLQIDLPALEDAYAHETFSVHRKEIEQLREHWLTGSKISQDLVCPFPATGDRAESHKHMVQQMRQEAFALGTLIGTMAPQERKQIAQGNAAPPQLTSSQGPQIEVGASVPKSGAAKKTFQLSEVGTNLLKDMIFPKKKAVKRPPPTDEDLRRSWGR